VVIDLLKMAVMRRLTKTQANHRKHQFRICGDVTINRFICGGQPEGAFARPAASDG
jgi:hypothetical protein